MDRRLGVRGYGSSADDSSVARTAAAPSEERGRVERLFGRGGGTMSAAAREEEATLARELGREAAEEAASSPVVVVLRVVSGPNESRLMGTLDVLSRGMCRELLAFWTANPVLLRGPALIVDALDGVGVGGGSRGVRGSTCCVCCLSSGGGWAGILDRTLLTWS